MIRQFGDHGFDERMGECRYPFEKDDNENAATPLHCRIRIMPCFLDMIGLLLHRPDAIKKRQHPPVDFLDVVRRHMRPVAASRHDPRFGLRAARLHVGQPLWGSISVRFAGDAEHRHGEPLPVIVRQGGVRPPVEHALPHVVSPVTAVRIHVQAPDPFDEIGLPVPLQGFRLEVFRPGRIRHAAAPDRDQAPYAFRMAGGQMQRHAATQAVADQMDPANAHRIEKTCHVPGDDFRVPVAVLAGRSAMTPKIGQQTAVSVKERLDLAAECNDSPAVPAVQKQDGITQPDVLMEYGAVANLCVRHLSPRL